MGHNHETDVLKALNNMNGRFNKHKELFQYQRIPKRQLDSLVIWSNYGATLDNFCCIVQAHNKERTYDMA